MKLSLPHDFLNVKTCRIACKARSSHFVLKSHAQMYRRNNLEAETTPSEEQALFPSVAQNPSTGSRSGSEAAQID